MPFLDIATTQPCVRNNVCSVSSRTFFGTRLLFSEDIRFVSSWNSFRIPSKAPNSRIKLFRSGLRIMVVATLKKGPTKSNEEQNDFGKYSNSDVEQQSSSEEAEDLDEREKLRRMRISKANKGNKPWNLGRKHSPETLRRIRERTRLAMQDPKVKMKLVNPGHAQSEETRMKIGAGVRMGWEKRRGVLRLQETFYYEWQNLIAEASRRGSQGEEELQWDSYEILNEQLEQEWLRSVEERKHMPRPKGGKRAPKSAEQRRKISEAMVAKWANRRLGKRVIRSDLTEKKLAEVKKVFAKDPMDVDMLESDNNNRDVSTCGAVQSIGSDLTRTKSKFQENQNGSVGSEQTVSKRKDRETTPSSRAEPVASLESFGVNGKPNQHDEMDIVCSRSSQDRRHRKASTVKEPILQYVKCQKSKIAA